MTALALLQRLRAESETATAYQILDAAICHQIGYHKSSVDPARFDTAMEPADTSWVTL